MAQLGEVFDGSDVVEQSGGNFKMLPSGDYKALSVKSDYVNNSSGTGKIAKYEFDVIEGPFAGRKIFSNFNLVHNSEQAQEIGRSQFDQFRKACGHGPVQDTADLENKIVVIRMLARPAKNDHERQYADEDGIINEVKQFKSVSQGVSAAPQTTAERVAPTASTTAAPSVAQASGAGASGAPPWAG